MGILAEGRDALNVRARTVIEIAKICETNGHLKAVLLVFTDGLFLSLTVWTDWRR
ncbi:hypothetical protein ABZ403_29980 [Micromonospora zamorensis]|uniref:hypothetical protein n=1 Tax=Micromonospora zamorensis TaxID=709883 RepID=UPI0033C40171